MSNFPTLITHILGTPALICLVALDTTACTLDQLRMTFSRMLMVRTKLSHLVSRRSLMGSTSVSATWMAVSVLVVGALCILVDSHSGLSGHGRSLFLLFVLPGPLRLP